MLSEPVAKKWAAVAAGLVGVVAVALVVFPGVRDVRLAEDVYARRMIVERVETDAPDGRTVTVTSKPADDSTIERALGEGGLLLVRVGIAAAAAFLAGAVVLRVLLGRYGFKAGGLELDDVTTAAEASAAALEALKAIVDEQQSTLASTMRTAAEAMVLAAETTRRLETGPDGA